MHFAKICSPAMRKPKDYGIKSEGLLLPLIRTIIIIFHHFYTRNKFATAVFVLPVQLYIKNTAAIMEYFMLIAIL